MIFEKKMREYHDNLAKTGLNNWNIYSLERIKTGVRKVQQALLAWQSCQTPIEGKIFLRVPHISTNSI